MRFCYNYILDVLNATCTGSLFLIVRQNCNCKRQNLFTPVRQRVASDRMEDITPTAACRSLAQSVALLYQIKNIEEWRITSDNPELTTFFVP